jgi:hypothetical protein
VATVFFASEKSAAAIKLRATVKPIIEMAEKSACFTGFLIQKNLRGFKNLAGLVYSIQK